jgi:hypothetical protein
LVSAAGLRQAEPVRTGRLPVRLVARVRLRAAT